MSSIPNTSSADNNSSQFTDTLEMQLVLTINDNEIKVPGANIKGIDLHLYPYGFDAQLNFWVSAYAGDQDELIDLFLKDDLINVSLEMTPRFKQQNYELETLHLQGIVTTKAILAETIIDNVELKDAPVLYRRYQIDFADPAQVLWQQHFPFDLLVDQSVSDLIEANNIEEIALNCAWESLNTVYAINTLPGAAQKNEASFYDFIIWFTATNNGVFWYDHNNNQYHLTDSKNDQGEAIILTKNEVANQQIHFPATARHEDRLLNAYSEGPTKKPIANAQKVNGLKRDLLVRMPVLKDFNDFYNLESTKPKKRAYELIFTHNHLPQTAWYPGLFAKIEEDLWSDKIFIYGNEYRIDKISIRARAVNEDIEDERNMPYSRYNFLMQSVLELKDELAVHLPTYKKPAYPVMVEGIIVSEQGSEQEETYQFYEHPQNKLDHYRIKIPLFDDKQVVAPYEPLFASGHFYFPAYKGERVLLLLDFHKARIDRFLDWRPGCRLPMDSQGNHLLLGKNNTSNTSISHIYENQIPQLNIKRTSAGDTEKIQFHEGTIILETKEEG